MGIGVGVLLLAIGAILAFAVDPTIVEGIDLDTVGIILMAVGALAILLSLFVFEGWRTIPRGRAYERREVV